MKTNTRKPTRKPAAKKEADMASKRGTSAKIGLSPFRRHFILAQALYEAIRALKALPLMDRPESNIEDMEYLLRRDFPGYLEAFEKMKEIHDSLNGGGK